MNRVHSVRLFPLLAVAALAACSGGGGSTGDFGASGSFVVLQTEPSDNGMLFLNDPISIDFSSAVDLDSVDLTTFSFQVLDQIGNTVAEPVAGTFALDASPGDDFVGRRLQFKPKLPTNNLFTNGGFRPGRTYVVQLVGGNRVTGTVLRDQRGKGLEQPISFRFNTSDGTTPAQLFRNTAPGGPRLNGGIQITPDRDLEGRVVLNKLGTPPVEVRLRFNQPLNPSSTNVPVDLDTDPLVRNPQNRGRIFLQFDDPLLAEGWWIPADVELEENAFEGATIVLRPVGVLPNNATVQVVVESTLEDISGESNVSLGEAYVRTVATFQTKRSFEQQFDGIVQDFLAAGAIDPTAAFIEPMAEVGPGFVKAGFGFEGTTTGADFNPLPLETVLNTDFTQVTPSNGAAFNVSGGVFNFRNVTIAAGKTVKGQGSNPMVWLVTGSFTVAGQLSVRGGDGTKVNSSGNAYLPKAGGLGVCGGGDGGAGTPSTNQRDERGGRGNGPLQAPGMGGEGGALACNLGCSRGSGGGGGSFVTQGDPNFKQKAAAPVAPQVFTTFHQQLGIGGNGCTGNTGLSSRFLQGGAPGPTTFIDSRSDNNFWGVGIRFDGTPLRITGELAAPTGGGGGGGGGDWAFNGTCDTDDPGFGADGSGGGGGGGGGALIVKALGPIVISAGGRITADGGSGGGGEAGGACSRGGGGGGGAGGMVVLMSATRIDINAFGPATGTNFRYATPENNYQFSISADGGVCSTLSAPPAVASKYLITNPSAAVPTAVAYATAYDSAPLGGFGGMGIVQLMAPPGTAVPGPASPDQTDTRLDDNIDVYRLGVKQLGATKRDLLAWRGFPNAFGQGVNDLGGQTNIGDNEGDIRPSPILLPVPFGAKSRARSRWIDTGSTKRQVSEGPLQPRFIDQTIAQLGPRYEFAGVDANSANATLGYALFDAPGLTATVQYPTAVAATGILTTVLNSTFLGQPAYRVQLTSPVLGTDVDRYSQYEAEALTSADAQIGSFRILSHTDRELVLSTESGSFPTNAAKMRVRAKFFDVVTGGVQGLGTTYEGAGGQRVPIANLRIGFAFHQDPANASATRYPAGENTFAYDLSEPSVQETIRLLEMPFVQWDVIFDRAFVRGPSDTPPVFSPDTPRPELHFLRLPYRY